VDVADDFAEKLVPRGVHLSFLDNMIYEGKKLYLEQQLLPKKERCTPRGTNLSAKASATSTAKYFLSSSVEM